MSRVGLNPRQRSALDYAEAGLRVFPVAPRSKQPMKGLPWPDVASSRLDRVEATWRRHPDANVGVLCQGLMVVDVDGPAGEEATKGLGLPETTTVRSSRGRHYYFRGDGRGRRLGPELEVKAGRMYVIGAGSIHEETGREYEWERPIWEAGIAPAPSSLLERLTRPAPRPDWNGGPLLKGERNVALTSIAGSLRRSGISPDAISAALHEENVVRCRPHLPRAEVDRIAANVCRMSGPPAWLVSRTRFIEDERLSHRARLLLYVLADKADLHGQVRGGEWLAEVAGLHRNRISEAVAELEAAGRVRVTRGRRRANVYELVNTFPEGRR